MKWPSIKTEHIAIMDYTNHPHISFSSINYSLRGAAGWVKTDRLQITPVTYCQNYLIIRAVLNSDLFYIDSVIFCCLWGLAIWLHWTHSFFLKYFFNNYLICLHIRSCHSMHFISGPAWEQLSLVPCISIKEINLEWKKPNSIMFFPNVS